VTLAYRAGEGGACGAAGALAPGSALGRPPGTARRVEQMLWIIPVILAANRHSHVGTLCPIPVDCPAEQVTVRAGDCHSTILTRHIEYRKTFSSSVAQQSPRQLRRGLTCTTTRQDRPRFVANS
jgi:hypothetical protein